MGRVRHREREAVAALKRIDRCLAEEPPGKLPDQALCFQQLRQPQPLDAPEARNLLGKAAGR
jgi:hypothetical protein